LISTVTTTATGVTIATATTMTIASFAMVASLDAVALTLLVTFMATKGLAIANEGLWLQTLVNHPGGNVSLSLVVRGRLVFVKVAP